MNNEKREMICTVGIPGCGKSTWADEQVYPRSSNFVKVERDHLRATHYTTTGNLWDYKFSRAKEKQITERQERRIHNHLNAGLSVIVADTNLNEGTRNRMEAIGSEYGVQTQFRTFDVPFHQTMKWNANRPDSVPDSVMIHMERKMRKYLGKYVQTPAERDNATVPSCVIMDIDGTLANMRGIRGPYDWDKVHLDQPIKHVVDYAQHIWHDTDHSLVLFSGRDGSSRQLTKDWLAKQSVYYAGLYMRPEGSTINDSLLKEQFFYDHIQGKFTVDHIVDDRHSVVNMWCSMGFNVMDVGNRISDF